MLQNNLLDELRLVVNPVIAGSGKRLFKEGAS
jgi:dihydrofolate reductase